MSVDVRLVFYIEDILFPMFVGHIENASEVIFQPIAESPFVIDNFRGFGSCLFPETGFVPRPSCLCQINFGQHGHCSAFGGSSAIRVSPSYRQNGFRILQIFFDQGPEDGCDDPNCAPGCDCDRYLEIWNLVFTQFNKMPDGSYEPLQHKNIDTGAGLERLASVLQGCKTNFETDLIFPIIEATAKRAGVKYNEDPNTDVSLKVIADHARAVTALISDGVLPSNEGRGYVLRRILRRAVRHGRLLGIEGIFLTPLIDVVVDILGPGIKSIAEKQDFVKRVVQNEEERFNQTLEQGLELLNSLIDTLAAEKATVVPGTEVFKLYDTYGFPWELTEEIASERTKRLREKGITRDMDPKSVITVGETMSPHPSLVEVIMWTQVYYENRW